jgi:tryptophan halogenase
MSEVQDNAEPIIDPREERVRSVLIVGGGSAGWMAATMLATALSKDIKIRLVESDAIGVVGVGEATIPPIKKFNRFCQVDEQAFLKETNGTFKLGIEFHNWGKPGDRYMHPFGYVGRELDAVVKLHHWWLTGQLAGTTDYPAWEDMFVATAAARENRFALPVRRPNDPLAKFAYAYHFDAILYGQHLRRIAERRGVERIEGRIISVNKASETGLVSDVQLEDGRKLEADLFLDCSGLRSLLLGNALEEPFDDWSHWLPSDRAIAVPSESSPHGLSPYTKGIAHTVGWQWRIPLQNRIGNGHVFSSSFSNVEDAERRLLQSIDTEPLDTPRLIKFQTGRRKRLWVGNVVAVGLSAGFLEPLESTSIHLVQSGLEQLLDLFPSRRMDPALRDRYNAQVEREWHQVRDFIIAHYKLNQRDDSEFWKYTANMDVPDSLVEVLQLWRERGILGVDGGHLFQTGSWTSIFYGQNFSPRRPHALSDRASPEAVAADVRRIFDEVKLAAQRLPDHSEFIGKYCASPQAG